MDTMIQIQVRVLRAGMGMVSWGEFCLFPRMVRGMDNRIGPGMVLLLFGMADLIRAVRVLVVGACIVFLMIVRNRFRFASW